MEDNIENERRDVVLTGRRSVSRGLDFCLSMAISTLLLLYLGHCQGLQPEQSTKTRHKKTGIILGEISEVCNGFKDSNPDRRKILRHWFGSATAFGLVSSSPEVSSSSTSFDFSNDLVVRHPFAYSDTWKGTNLKTMSLEESTSTNSYSSDERGMYWAMGRWPDPSLRIPAKPVDPSLYSNARELQRLELAATILRDTALREGAVGLAAQQCGVDARMVFLSSSDRGKKDRDVVLINPRIVARSPESSMKVWTEECLVLPPTFRATVLRDDWIDVAYDFSYEYRPGKTKEPTLVSSSAAVSVSDFSTRFQTPIVKRFYKEQSRCLQHELDHDRGILITDHVGLDELENDIMRMIEARDHDRRQVLAYSRQ